MYTWAECEAAVKGFSNAAYKSFKTLAEAKQYLKEGKTASASPCKIQKSHTSTRQLSTAQQAKIETSTSPQAVNSPKWHPGDYFFWDKKPAKNISGRVIVYTDGACSNNGFAGSKAGCGVYFPGHPELSCKVPLLGEHQTNQRAELEAIRHALRIANQHPDLQDTELEIRTDSQYAIKGLTEWSVNWERSNWQKEIRNRDLFEDILKLRRQRSDQVYIRYVPGHSGEPGNEEADRLAVQAIDLPRV